MDKNETRLDMQEIYKGSNTGKALFQEAVKALEGLTLEAAQKTVTDSLQAWLSTKTYQVTVNAVDLTGNTVREKRTVKKDVSNARSRAENLINKAHVAVEGFAWRIKGDAANGFTFFAKAKPVKEAAPADFDTDFDMLMSTYGVERVLARLRADAEALSIPASELEYLMVANG